MQRQAIKRTPMSAPRSTPTAQATRAKKGPEKITVAQYLLTRLFAFNAKRLISIEHTDLESLNGYAGGDRIAAASSISAIQIADGYAKAMGFSACAITQDAPGFVDAIVRAHEEQVPQVIIVGSHYETIEPLAYLESGLRELTCGWTVLDDPKLAARKIDHALDCCSHFQQPVVIELPEDIAAKFIPPHRTKRSRFTNSTPKKKPTRPKAKQTYHKLLGVIDHELQKVYAGVVCSEELIPHFKGLEQATRIINTSVLHRPSYALESAIGAAFAKPDECMLVLMKEDELHHSFTALAFAQKVEAHIVVVVFSHKNTAEERYSEKNDSDWSLTELAHLFVDGNAIHVETQKAFETALHQALHATEGVFLIEASFTT